MPNGERRDRVVAYSSGVLYSTATTAYGRLDGSQGDLVAGQNDALVAIVFSALSFESFLNDVEDEAVRWADLVEPTAYLSFLGRVLKQAEQSRAGAEVKLQFLLWILTQGTVDSGSAPLQNFALLQSLRNAIVHHKPDDTTRVMPDLSFQQTPTKLLKSLESKHLVAPGLGSWLSKVSTRAAARWACNTTSRIVQLVASSAPQDVFGELLRSRQPQFPRVT